MRTIFILFIIISNASFAQLSAGFEPDEARSLIAICNSYSFTEFYGSDTLIVPKGYQKVFTSEVIGLDNMFQVHEKGNVGVISFRGSTAKASSWVENVYSAMIPAEEKIKINDKNHHYKFASDTAAAVHSGYALTVVLLAPVLIEQINKLNDKGIYNILITGHSQGGALAHLSRAYLENLPKDVISSENVFKTYAFANPMCGNREFANEYNNKYSDNGMSYSIINPDDFVPKLPMNYKEEKSGDGNLFQKTWDDFIKHGEVPTVKDLVIQAFEPALKKYINSSNNLIEKLVNTVYISIEMPEYVHDINYFQTGSVRYLEPFIEPKIPVDTLHMAEKEIAELEQGEDGNYYIKIKSSFQHKPYQYYVAILRKYFHKEYMELDALYLPEEIQ